MRLPIPVTARSMAWVCGRSLAGAASSSHAGGKAVCLLSVLFILMVDISETDTRTHTYAVCVRVSLSVIRDNNNPLNPQE